MQQAKILDRTSGFFFFLGFIISKLQYIPLVNIATIFRFLGLGVLLTGYGFSFTAHLHLGDHEPLRAKWYGFAKMKIQFILSSVIGFAATCVNVGAIFLPALFPPAAWLLMVGNLFWSIGEYHKFKNPSPQQDDFCPHYQEHYFLYSTLTTTISFVTALAATLIFLLPIYTIPIMVSSVLVCCGLGIFAAENWIIANFSPSKKGISGMPDSSSHIEMIKTFNADSKLTSNPSKEFEAAPQDNHHHSVIISPKKSDIQRFDTPDKASSPAQSSL
ncbi:MAG: hypothetical protein BGO90_08990 [Legionella sp. 40-6]|nr:hypothetical protein [Legionella sp.]OJY28967.1 MAG: hypothetical protein BGO90_08990 [Legionella sp. 40-6]